MIVCWDRLTSVVCFHFVFQATPLRGVVLLCHAVRRFTQQVLPFFPSLVEILIDCTIVFQAVMCIQFNNWSWGMLGQVVLTSRNMSTSFINSGFAHYSKSCLLFLLMRSGRGVNKVWISLLALFYSTSFSSHSLFFSLLPQSFIICVLNYFKFIDLLISIYTPPGAETSKWTPLC